MLRDVHGPTPRMQLNQEANRDVSYPEAYHSPGSPALSPALGGRHPTKRHVPQPLETHNPPRWPTFTNSYKTKRTVIKGIKSDAK